MPDAGYEAESQQDGDTFAVIIHNGLPYGLFEDMETATEYAEDHERMALDEGDTQVFWPIRVKG